MQNEGEFVIFCEVEMAKNKLKHYYTVRFSNLQRFNERYNLVLLIKTIVYFISDTVDLGNENNVVNCSFYF